MLSQSLPGPLQGLIFAVTINGRWQPGIGDPTVMGWVTTLGYFAAGMLCLRLAAISFRDPALRGKPFQFWTACGVLMLALCLNKQLDLQSLATQIAKDWAKAGGWYEVRRGVQVAFFIGLAGACAAAFAFAIWFIRGARWHYYFALAGLVFTGCFVLARAASFHHMDQFLGFEVAGIRMNWVLELGGIFVVGAAALVRDTPSGDAATSSQAE